MLWILKVDIQYLIAAQDRKSPVFLPGPRRLLPLCAPIKWDEGGQVGGAQLRLEHSGGHLRGQVNTTQPSHTVEIFVKEMNNKMSGWQLTLRAKLASYPSTAFFIFSSQDLKDKGSNPRLTCMRLNTCAKWIPCGSTSPSLTRERTSPRVQINKLNLIW